MTLSKPARIYRYFWLKPLMLALFAVFPVVLGMGMYKLIGPVLGNFLIFWALTAAIFIMIFAEKDGLVNANNTGTINKEDYKHWHMRAKLGLYCTGATTLGMAAFFVFMALPVKITATFTAVPTPELMSELNFYYEDEKTSFSTVEYNGKEQKVTVYTDRKRYSGLTARAGKSTGEFPEYYYEGKKLKLDSLTQFIKKPYLHEGQSKCFYSRKLISPPKSNVFLNVSTNLDFKHNGVFIYKGELVFDASSYSDNGCRLSHLSPSSPGAQLKYNLRINIQFPHITFKIKQIKESKRLSITSWEELKDRFG